MFSKALLHPSQADVTAMIARKNLMNKKQNANAVTLEKARLHQARMLALGRNEHAEVAQIDKQLAALTGESTLPRPPTRADELAKLNERNRRANIEAARKIEMIEAERKRKERKLAAAANGAATPPPDRLKLLKNADLSRFVLPSLFFLSLRHDKSMLIKSLAMLVRS